jgi:long-chain fatty acid transport protein
MVIRHPLRAALLALVLLVLPGRAAAQIVESVGSRALGMGGAFVAVADDSSATWWNPGALAAGPFIDMAIGRAVSDSAREIPSRRDRASWFAVGTPPFGLSYYRLQVTEAGTPPPTGEEPDGRQDEPGTVPVRSLSARQFGVTIVQTLVSGVHVGTTLKYARGRVRSGVGASPLTANDLLDLGEDFEGGEADNRFDLDIGVLAVTGPVRLGALVRNLREPEFGSDTTGGAIRLPRQVRVGAAYDGAGAGVVPLTISFDADLRRYGTVSGDRRVVALGAEGWLLRRRVGLRGGARFNTVGAESRAATAGLSVALRSGLYLDGHLVRGGDADERGWGIAARVSF